MAAPDSYELVLLVKQEVFLFRLPPLAGNKGYRAADWNLGNPDWIGRLRLFSIDEKIEIRLEDRNTGQLFGKAPISGLNNSDFEPVTDSSRYFVIRLRNDNGRTAFVGIGFSDRSDSFDLNVAIQDHFKSIKKAHEISNEEENQSKFADLSLKEGETITVNIGNKSSPLKSRPSKTPTTDSSSNATIPFLPPPPVSANNRVKRKN